MQRALIRAQIPTFEDTLNRMNLLKCLIIIFVISSTSSNAQNFDLPIPEKWTTEIFPIPIDFAPEIKYKGEEHLRFSPGWGDSKSDELWTYFFMWWIDANSEITEKTLTDDLQHYYSGLVGRNIIRRKIDSALVVPTVVRIVKSDKVISSGNEYIGEVHMLDYLSLRPITLNVNVQVVRCGDERVAALFAISPQPRSHRLWAELLSIQQGFKCKK